MKDKSKEELIELIEELQQETKDLKEEIKSNEDDNKDYEDAALEHESVAEKAFNAGYRGKENNESHFKSWLNYKIGAEL